MNPIFFHSDLGAEVYFLHFDHLLCSQGKGLLEQKISIIIDKVSFGVSDLGVFHIFAHLFSRLMILLNSHFFAECFFVGGLFCNQIKPLFF